MKLLLDEHLPKAVAGALRRYHPGADAEHIADWERGRWLGEEDPVLLEGLWEDKRILASYDRATLPGHLAERVGQGNDHAGVIFIDQERFPPVQVGKMARALAKLLAAYPARRHWINRIVTLTTD
jgi:hypothetical protein